MLRKVRHDLAGEVATGFLNVYWLMPIDHFVEFVRLDVADLERYPKVIHRMPPLHVGAELGQAMIAVAVMLVEIVGDVAIHAAVDAALDPGLEHGLPGGIAEAAPVLLHPADAVAVLRDRLAVRAALEELQRIGNRLWSKLLLVPQVAIELEEPRRAF